MRSNDDQLQAARSLFGGSIPPRLQIVTAPPLKSWTRSEVARIEAAGLFAGLRLELIDGQLFDKSGQTPLHASTVCGLAASLSELFGARRLRVLSPVEPAESDAETNMPEPDVVVTREADLAYRSRHPGVDDVILIAEVTDTTYDYDTKRKAKLYARAGYPEYLILDLNERELLVYRSPRGGVYTTIQVLREGDMYSPIAAPEQSISVRELF
jgi:Uma2 family endonuclease